MCGGAKTSDQRRPMIGCAFAAHSAPTQDGQIE